MVDTPLWCAEGTAVKVGFHGESNPCTERSDACSGGSDSSSSGSNAGYSDSQTNNQGGGHTAGHSNGHSGGAGKYVGYPGYPHGKSGGKSVE